MYLYEIVGIREHSVIFPYNTDILEELVKSLLTEGSHSFYYLLICKDCNLDFFSTSKISTINMYKLSQTPLNI